MRTRTVASRVRIVVSAVRARESGSCCRAVRSDAPDPGESRGDRAAPWPFPLSVLFAQAAQRGAFDDGLEFERRSRSTRVAPGSRQRSVATATRAALRFARASRFDATALALWSRAERIHIGMARPSAMRSEGCDHGFMAACTHLDSIERLELPEPVVGCAECLPAGTRWVHLRMCQTCGHIGCCDDSPGRHASPITWRAGIRSCARPSRARTGAGASWTS
jgi:hypothetical protein